MFFCFRTGGAEEGRQASCWLKHGLYSILCSRYWGQVRTADAPSYEHGAPQKAPQNSIVLSGEAFIGLFQGVLFLASGLREIKESLKKALIKQGRFVAGVQL